MIFFYLNKANSKLNINFEFYENCMLLIYFKKSILMKYQINFKIKFKF